MAFGRRAAAPAGADLRRDPRVPVAIHATARAIDGAPVEVAIDDLSTHGFRAMIPLALREGMLLRVRLPNGRAPHARVVHVQDQLAGCEFLAPLDEETLAALIAG